MNTQNVIYALEIMGKGMASIFIVIGILTLIVVLLSKITNKSVSGQDEATEKFLFFSRRMESIILLSSFI